MKTVGLGPVKEVTPDFQRFEVPAGAKFLLLNPESGFVQLEVEETFQTVSLVGEKDFQVLNEATGRYVRVDFKKTEGPFRGIPVR
jgi:hypothetical protein